VLGEISKDSSSEEAMKWLDMDRIDLCGNMAIMLVTRTCGFGR
jgi:hypothetical protein